MMTTLALILAAFAIGVVVGDWRAMRVFTTMMSAHLDNLLNVMMEGEATTAVDTNDDDDARPTVH